jgi:molybdate/tungstate transport system ATP-binding protein
MEARDARTLSSGEMQRVSLARALALKPGLLLLDEPFANIDRESVQRIEETVRDLGQNGTTVVMVSHRMEEAYHFSANVVRLERGRPAPPEIENVFECGLSLEEGECCARVPDGLTFAVSGTRTGPARIAVPPSDIILSAMRLESSMRNVFAGKITGLRKMAERIEVTVDIGRPLKVYITRKSLEEMRLGIGTAIFASFKANAVKVF